MPVLEEMHLQQTLTVLIWIQLKPKLLMCVSVHLLQHYNVTRVNRRSLLPELLCFSQ